MLIPKIDEIIRRRMEAGYTRQRLSLEAGLPKNAILRIEEQQVKYTYPIRARAIANALQCGVEDIFADTKGA